MKKTILVICHDNIFLSKVAEVYLKRYAGHWKKIVSGGLEKGTSALDNITAITSDSEIVENLKSERKSVDEYSVEEIDFIIYIGQSESELKKCEEKYINKYIFHFDIPADRNEQTIKVIDSSCLNFVKKGTIKRWLDN